MMRPAIFAKNYPEHLESAAKIAISNPDQWVVFRSSVPWVQGKELLETYGAGAVPILLAAVDGGPVVAYRALLQEVHLRPSEDNSRTMQLMALRPPSTEGEQPLENGSQTLYAISGCRLLESPIAFEQLVKLNGGEPLSPHFKYSYALVMIADDDSYRPSDVGTDLAAAPSRIEETVSRIVRDTRLVQLLKRLYDDTCQLCRTRLDFGGGRGYSEGHHIRPLGRPHEGPDDKSNILILCPNCHALCDNITFKLDSDMIYLAPGHEIASDFLRYHNEIWKRKSKPATDDELLSHL